MRSKEITIVGIILSLVAYILALSLTGQVLSAGQTSKTFSNTGAITAIGVGVYWDNSCTDPVSSIAWGTLEPGSTKDVTCYIRNKGNSVLTLSMYASNWSPSNASSYMSLSWDYGGQSIDVDEVVQVVFTLSVDAGIAGITSFSFDIAIVGSG